MEAKDRLLQRVLGGTLEPGVGSLLAATGLGVTAQYAFWSFFAVWAIERLGMAEGTVGLAYLGAAGVGIAGGQLGGRLSDRIGRKPVIVAAASAQATLPALLVLPSAGPALAVATLAALTFAGPVRGAAQTALMADLVPADRREQAFGTFRIVFNVGALSGPLIGAALVSVAWPVLHAGVAVLWGLSLLAALRLPSLPVAKAGASGGGRLRLRALAGNRAFAALFGAALLSMVVYNAFEVLLPVSLTQSHGYAPEAWGILFVINPVLVILFQLRVTRWSAGVAPAVKLPVALLLCGVSFLPLLVTAAPPALVFMLVAFVVGEMLWAPTADALASRLAPAHARGAYLATLGIATWVGGALAPAVGLRVRSGHGDAAMWAMIVTLAVAGAVLSTVAARSEGRTAAAAPAAEAQTALEAA